MTTRKAETMTTTTLRPQSSADDLHEAYDQSTDPAVVTYLRQHAWLVPLLQQAPVEIDRQFGPNTRVLLEVVTDPEEGDQALFARIRTSLAPADAMRRLDAFWDTWWFKALPKDGHLLHFDIRPE